MGKRGVGDIREFIVEHYQYFAVAVLFLVLVVVLVVFSLHRKKGDPDAAKAETEEETGIGTEPLDVPEDAVLEQNAHEEVNSFFTRYYQAVASGDVDTMAEMGQALDEENKAKVKLKANYTVDYENMSCYTKPGPEENSYIVLVYYEIKWNSVDTLAPGLSTYYVCTADDGSLYIKDIGSLPQNMKDYITAISNQSDVQNLLTEVDKLYKTNTDSDPTLKAFMDSLLTKAESAAAKVRETGGTAEEVVGDGSGTASPEVRVKTTDAVFIRSSPTTDEDNKLGKAQAGDSFVRIAEEGEWSKIRYKDEEAYIKSEYLTTAEGATAVAGEVQGGDATAAEGGDAAAAPASTGATAASGTITVNEAVSIRGSASTDGEKLGSAYKGTTFTVTGEENGWYKIDYNGRTAYIKGEFCTKN